MDINNNQQQNTFESGMNTDTSDARIASNQYRYARNVRLISNTGSNSAEIHMVEGFAKVGDLYNVKEVLATASIRNYGVIVADTTTDTNTPTFNVFYFKNKNNNTDALEYYSHDDIKQVFKTNVNGKLNKPLDIVCRYEQDDVIKIYLSDGNSPMLVINILKEYQDQINLENLTLYPSVLFSKPIFDGYCEGSLKGGLYQYSYRLYNKYGTASEISPATNLIPVVRQNNGYSYGVENDYSSGKGIIISVDIDNVVNLDYIQVIRTSYLESGQDPLIEIIYDAKIDSNHRFKLSDYCISGYQTLTLEEYNSMSGEHIIPKTIESKNDYLFAGCIKKFNFADAKTQEVFDNFDARSYSCDEDGMVRIYSQGGELEAEFDFDNIPELNDDNREWDCVNKNGNYYSADEKKYGSRGKYINWKFIKTNLYEDTTPCMPHDKTSVMYDSTQDWYLKTNQSHNTKPPYMDPNAYYNEFIGTTLPGIRKKLDNTELSLYKYIQAYEISNGQNGDKYNVKLHGVSDSDLHDQNYGNPKVAYSLKSLRRGETYRYAIVFYNKYGFVSDAKWIADIKVPELYTPGFETFTAHGECVDKPTDNWINSSYGNLQNKCDLVTHPIGIMFEITLPDKIKNNIIGYEIVRCNRNVNNIKNLMQGVLARPINKKVWLDNTKTEYSYTPTGWLTTARYWTGQQNRYQYKISGVDDDAKNGIIYEADNSENFNLYQFVSAETTYQPDSAQDLIKKNSVKLAAQRYLFGCSYDTPLNQWSSSQRNPSNNNEYYKTVNQTSLARVIKLGPYNTALRIGGVQIANYYNNQYESDPYKVYGFGTISEASPLFPLDVISKRLGWESIDNLKHSWAVGGTIGKHFVLPDVRQWYFFSYFNFAAKNKSESFIAPPSDGWKLDNINDKSFSYVKLYEQSNTITYRQPATSPTGGISLFPAFDGEFDAGGKQKDGYRKYNNISKVYSYKKSQVRDISCDITDSRISSVYDYYDLFTKSSDAQQQTIALNYSNIDNVGDYSYYNNIVDIAYNTSLPKIFKDQDDITGEDWTDSYKDTYQTIFGIGGRCMLLQLQYKNLQDDRATFYNTSAAIDRLNFQNKIVTPSPVCIGTSNGFKQDLPNVITYFANNKEFGQADFTLNGENIFNKYLGGFDYQIVNNTKTNIYKPSIAGTFLCNVQQVPDIYGGQSYTARKENIYYSYGDFYKPQDKTQTIYVFDGDTYITPLEYFSMHKWATSDRSVKHPVRNSIIYSIPLESSINMDLTYGHEFSKNAIGNNAGNLESNAQINPVQDQNIGFTQSDKMYLYNSVYSTNQKARVFATDQDDTQSLRNVDYRVYYSSPKENNEVIDSWCKFQTSNYIDVDTRYGSINKLRTFQNSLLFWQDNAFGKLAVNERSVITDNSNAALSLGTGGVLERYDYISTLYGMKKGQITDTQSDSSIYWWDANNLDILCYNNGLKNLSKNNNLHDYINKNVNRLSQSARSTYDNKYREVIFQILDSNDNQEGQSIIYNEDASVFTSINDTHGNKTPFTITFQLGKYSITDNSIYKYNTSIKKHAYSITGKRITPYIKYVVNNLYQTPKVFDIQTFGGYFQDESENNVWDNKNDLGFNYFTKNSTYKDDQYYQISNVEGKDITNREYDYRLDIPRAKTDGKLSLFGNRMRGKTMIVEMYSNSNSVDFSLQYIITKYRISCS